jgi:hypothetical protein
MKVLGANSLTLPRLSWAATRVVPTAIARLKHLPALGLYFLLTVVMTLPYILHIQTSLYNWSDALLNTWTLAWGTHALLTDPLNLYNANIFYPYANTLAYSESLLPQTVMAMPIILATDMPALAHNLLALSSFALAAFGMYLLVFELTRSRAAGLVAGVIYTFTSYKFMHLAHLQLLSSQWMPFALLYLRKILTLQNGVWAKRGLHYSFLFAFFFALQALSSFYYAFFIAIAVGLYVAYVIVLRGWKMWRARHVTKSNAATTRVAPTVLSFALIALFTLPLALPYFSVQRDLGLERGVGDAEYYAATLRTYFSVPDNNWLYGKWLTATSRITGSGERDFVGFIALGLGVLGLVTRRRDVEKIFYILLALTGIILSFGARNEILLFPHLPKISLPFYLPYRYLFLYVPGFRAMRGPDRFAYLAVLGLAVLAGYGTQALLTRLRASRRPAFAHAANLVAGALVVLIAAENFAVPVRLTNPATLAKPIPDWTTFLSRAEPDAVVIELPMVYQKESLAWPQYYSIFHWHKLVNGFSGFFPPGYDALNRAMQDFPSAESLALLEEIGVRYVVVHNNLFTVAERTGIKTHISAFANRVRLVAHDPPDDVYQLDSAERGWGAALGSVIPPDANVLLKNSRADRREFFELAAAMLAGRHFSGAANAAYRPLAPVNQATDYLLTNVDDAVPSEFTRRVWSNDWLALYAR